MSKDTATTTPKAQKSKTEKSTSETKSAKKRRHEQQQATTTAEAVAEEEEEEGSRSKKPRIEAPTTTTATTTSTTSTTTTPSSPFVQQTSSFYLPIAPIYHSFPLDGLCAEHISPLLLTYYPPVRGVLLSYSNPRLSSSAGTAPPNRDAPDAEPEVLAKSIDEYAVSYVWLTVDFVVLRPTRGARIEGYVSVQNESYLGLVCWNFFNAGVERKRLPEEWQWVPHSDASASKLSSSSAGDWMRGRRGKGDESQGYFVDGQGKRVEGLIEFTVKDFESAPSSERERGFLSIEGTLLDRADDDKVDAEVLATRKQKPNRKW